MNQLPQAGSSNVTTFLPMKRRRGRPRKDPSIKHVEVSRAPPGYGVRENIPRQADTIDFRNGGMVGQTVTGVIEAAFDAGYMLTVRIDNSNTSFRGVVFKPGHAAPLTALNDIAPHVQMSKRNEVPLPLENQPHSNGPRERIINGALHLSRGQRLSSQPSPPVASKGKHALTTSPFSHLNGRGTVVPVVLQPATAFSASPQTDSSDKDVVAAEPLSVLLPFGSQSSNQFLSSKSEQQQPSRVPPGSSQNANDSFNNGPHVNEEGGEAEKLTQADVPVTVIQGSSVPSYTHDGKSDSCGAISQLGMDQGIPDISSPHAATHRLKNDGSARMTDLLQSMQERFRPVVDSNVELQNAQNPNLESNDQAAW